MANNENNTVSPWRPLLALLVFLVLGVGTLLVGNANGDTALTPKLALDLEGGTQVILTPKAVEGSGAAVDQEAMAEAINIIRQRIDASGVTEAEISTLGSDSIVVAIPGDPDPETLDLVRHSATMRFRPVLQILDPAPADPSLAVPQSGEPDVSGLTVEEYALLVADTDGDGVLSDTPATTPVDNSDLAWATEQLLFDAMMLDCTDSSSIADVGDDDPNAAMVACGSAGDAKYLLGPADIEGTNIANASAGMIYNSAGASTGQMGVNLEFDAEGTAAFAESSQRLFALQTSDPVRNRFAVVLDGNVISAPSMNTAILDGKAQISGAFTAAEARNLANQLNFGSLPLNFEVQSEQQISATLGSNYLEKGLMAGLIGLGLVLVWMLYQYRGLALLSAGSLLVAGAVVYLAIVLLSWGIGYRLSLPGVAGLIIAVGITADSFIVYFERVRDEVRDGLPLDVAVERGWSRAKRTILISDAVNLVAAVVLYVLAVGGVQGFAFTLGLTTIVDLVVVFMFTHPVMTLLMRTKFFGGGSRWSGLDPELLGAKAGPVYQGRGRARQLQPVGAAKPKAQSDGLSIAQRRRAQQQAESLDVPRGDDSDKGSEA